MMLGTQIDYTVWGCKIEIDRFMNPQFWFGSLVSLGEVID